MSEKAQGTQTIPKAFGMVQSSESRQIGTNAKPLSQDEYNVQFEQEATAFEAMREKLLEECEGKFVAVYGAKLLILMMTNVRFLSEYYLNMVFRCPSIFSRC
jgi:hypothetical protein